MTSSSCSFSSPTSSSPPLCLFLLLLYLFLSLSLSLSLSLCLFFSSPPPSSFSLSSLLLLLILVLHFPHTGGSCWLSKLSRPQPSKHQRCRGSESHAGERNKRAWSSYPDCAVWIAGHVRSRRVPSRVGCPVYSSLRDDWLWLHSRSGTAWQNLQSGQRQWICDVERACARMCCHQTCQNHSEARSRSRQGAAPVYRVAGAFSSDASPRPGSGRLQRWAWKGGIFV